MKARVTLPNGIMELVPVLDIGNSFYGVEFVSKQLGLHTITFEYKNIHVPNSPFQFTVGPSCNGLANRVDRVVKNCICQLNDHQVEVVEEEEEDDSTIPLGIHEEIKLISKSVKIVHAMFHIE